MEWLRHETPATAFGAHSVSSRKIRYGGITGKIAAVGIVYLLTICVAIVFGHNFYSIVLISVVAALIGLVFVILRIEKVFSINPAMATLEGTEVIKYRQNELASKNHPLIPITEIITEPESVLLETSTSEDDIAQEEA